VAVVPFAYILMCARCAGSGFAGTKLERATCGNDPSALLKIGALVTISVPARVKLAFALGLSDAPRVSRLAARRL